MTEFYLLEKFIDIIEKFTALYEQQQKILTMMYESQLEHNNPELYKTLQKEK